MIFLGTIVRLRSFYGLFFYSMLNGLVELLLFCEAVVLSWFVKLLFVNCIQYSFSLVNKKKKKKNVYMQIQTSFINFFYVYFVKQWFPTNFSIRLIFLNGIFLRLIVQSNIIDRVTIVDAHALQQADVRMHKLQNGIRGQHRLQRQNGDISLHHR